MKNKKSNILTPIASKVSFIGLYSNVARAYEICIAGGHTMSFAYFSDPDDRERSVNPEDIRLVHDFFAEAADGHLRNDCIVSGDSGNLIIDFCRPDADTLLSCMRRGYETITDIHQRIEAAKQKPTPELSTLSAACFSLFKTGYNRLSFGVYEAEIVFNVSQTIARLEGSSIIRVEHIAEAIQYRAIQRVPTTIFYTF